jgi:hypothetical protein
MNAILNFTKCGVFKRSKEREEEVMLDSGRPKDALKTARQSSVLCNRLENFVKLFTMVVNPNGISGKTRDGQVSILLLRGAYLCRKARRRKWPSGIILT